MRTQVAIVGAGPAGMLLSHLLGAAGIETVVVEQRSKAYVAARIRAGVLEQRSVEVLRAAGLADRLDREGHVHDGVFLATANRGFRVDFRRLTGRSVTIYGQTEVQRDLDAAAAAAGRVVFEEAPDVAVHDVTSARPSLTFTHRGRPVRVEADLVAGCDGHWGVCRGAFPPSLLRTYERVYPFAWLGVLSETPPVSSELIYCQHERGFALCSMRSPVLSRCYVQCAADEQVEAWSDARFWDELRRRLPSEAAESIVTGPSIEKSITPLRSFVVEPLRHGRLFLAGDAAHIVPPTGAKGLNLAVSDVACLAEAITAWYGSGDDSGLEAYSERALARVWKAVRFSWWMTTLLHRFPDADGGRFGQRLQEAELSYLAESEAAQTALAENYTGLAT
ncbi:MAG: 4-hydroxybenzoate 3-monooxygenase [Acidimicrobiales bacterium]